MYVLVVMLALVSCAIGFAVEIAWSNINHVKNGRLPNAGAVLFPNIPFVPLTYVAVAWVLDLLHRGLGPKVVAAYACAAICTRVYLLIRARAQLRKLNADSTGSAA